MKVLVLGQGGREHAIVRSLAHSSSVTEVHAAPGNNGMKQHALCHEWSWTDHHRILDLCVRAEIDLIVIGPEDPLVAGDADRFRERGLLVVGPSQEGARLEGSKIFAKQFMAAAKIPTADYVEVDDVESCLRHANRFTPPYVLKADGLCAGKGVAICKTREELEQAAIKLFKEKIFGEAGSKAILEQFTPGWELSYLVMTNGVTWEALPIAQDHKRLQTGDQGPNTGGMGTVAPLQLDELLKKQIESQIVAPTIAEIQNRGIVYRGFIFFGIMVTPNGPSLLEFNCRLGDPETQVILPLIANDFGQLMRDLAQGKLQSLQVRPLHAACVVLAAPGYPENPEKGVPIEGDLAWGTESSYFLVAGAKRSSSGNWETSGGRVLGAIGLGSTRQESLLKAYHQADQVKWRGLQRREDRKSVV